MSIERRNGSVVIVCDSDRCPEEFVGPRGEQFKDVWDQAKQDGWRTRKIAGEWLHGCPKCGAPT